MGDIGHILLIATFIVTVLFFGFQIIGSRSMMAHKIFAYTQLFLISGIILLLYYLIFNNQFQYAYVWKHSSIDQAFVFKVASLWEGQEGSFLLWIFWNCIFIFLFSMNKNYQKTLLFLLPINAFLISMVLGVHCFGYQIGSSPFSLLKNTIQSEIYTINPNFIPTDGQGMNALLQNYWMAIHPPIIFLGFSMAAVPFCLCLSALCLETDAFMWVKQCLPWLFGSVALIALGMLMGAYWAYETLNFGGFWNWDPVENAIFIPWLLSLAAAHLALLFLKKEKAYKVLIYCILSSFILVIYSTFLTRSGILGDSSVHSFTDSGLSLQLLFFLICTIAISITVYQWNRKKLPKESNSKIRVFNYEFWMIASVILILTSALQVFLPTSFPVFNKISGFLGYQLSLATPSDQVSFYSKFQLWILVGLCVCLVTAQLLYSNKKERSKISAQDLFIPIIASTLFAFLLFFKFDLNQKTDLKYYLILLLCIFSFFFLIQLFTKNQNLSKNISSSISHLGLIVFFIGVLLSQGFSKIITHNNQFSSDLNRWGNILLVRDKPIDLGEYELSYQGSFVKTESDETIDKQTITPTNRQNIIRAKNQIKLKDKTLEVGEEMNVDVQNTFYSIHFKSATQEFDICPRVQANSKMGIIASPDINIHWDGDIYTHVSNFPDPNKSTLDWSNAQAISLKKNDVIFIGNKTIELIALDKQDSYNKQISHAQIKVSLPDTNYLVSCSLILSNDEYQVIPAEIPQLGFHLVMGKADIENNTVGIYTLSQPKDWITVKSMFFPFMYLVWIGGVSMIVGSFFAAFSWYKSSIKLDFIIQWFKNKLWSKETPALNVIK